MSCHFPRLCHDTCLIKYVVSDYHTRVSSGSSAKAGSAARIVSTVDCFLCRLNINWTSDRLPQYFCNGSSSCRRELSCLIYYTVNAARISAGSHTVHNNRTDCKLSFVALRFLPRTESVRQAVSRHPPKRPLQNLNGTRAGHLCGLCRFCRSLRSCCLLLLDRDSLTECKLRRHILCASHNRWFPCNRSQPIRLRSLHLHPAEKSFPVDTAASTDASGSALLLMRESVRLDLYLCIKCIVRIGICFRSRHAVGIFTYPSTFPDSTCVQVSPALGDLCHISFV